jgi:hypothetical protein
MKTCQNCGYATDNPKFCSKSCSAKFNNARNPKKKRTNTCITCGDLILTRLNECGKCRHEGSIQNKPLSYFETGKYKGSNKYGLIRFWARKSAENITNTCFNCGYSKHVEVCHIKAISDHSKETKVSFVNRIENLVKLCPNCHWEFDNGLICIGGKGGD